MWAPNWADLTKQAPSKKKLIRSNTDIVKPKIFKVCKLYKCVWFKITDSSKSYETKNIKKIATNKQKSLNLLKLKALNAAFKVPTLATQKLIKKNDVIPISSQPKNKVIKLPAVTKSTILMTNKFKKTSNRSTKGSYLKYAKAYKFTNKAIETVKNIKDADTKST